MLSMSVIDTTKAIFCYRLPVLCFAFFLAVTPATADVITSGDVTPDPLTSIGSHLYVGDTHDGTLLVDQNTVVNGQTAVYSHAGVIGNQSGASGAVTVRGAGSTWTNVLALVGLQGVGVLKIENGGSVSTSGISSIGVGVGSEGFVTVTGSNSIWTTSTPANGLFVGDNGVGSLTIQDGGSVVTAGDGQIGPRTSGQGTVTVTGAGSSWAIDNNLIVGGVPSNSGGSGTLNLLDGGAVDVMGVTWVWGPGLVNLKGGLLSTGTIKVLGQLNFTQGTLRLTDPGSVTIGVGSGIPGIFDATLSLGPGMALELPNQSVDVAFDGVLALGPTAAFSASGGSNAGHISSLFGSLSYTGRMINNSGTISATGSTLNFPGDGLPRTSGGDFFDGLINIGTLDFTDSTVNGDVHSPAGFAIHSADNVTFNGLVSGGANLLGANATITFNGGYEPGDGRADITIEGDVAFGSTNTLYLELAGTGDGQFDHLDIAGYLSIDGMLNIQLTTTFTPQLGDTFDLFDSASIAGAFTYVNLPVLSDGLTFDTSSLYTTGVITIVPEPSTLILAVLGGGIVISGSAR